MLLGTHTPKLDDKGRLILPAKFRRELEDGVVITRGQERCLYVFSAAEFERVHERMRQAPMGDKRARDFLRMFLAAASDEKPDSQNRVTIPPALRAYAGLERDLVVAGIGDHAEIWQAQRWTEYVAANEDAFAELEEEVYPGLF
ncbi:MAG TPA: division/cell wall cluster transcriptional repressor MraZ [Microbacterium sp.]|jgi:MraZ protein|nr:division/cell wall cluster transcriptional repressor MraZ [Microbacterium sp.]